MLNDDQRKTLLRIARQSIEATLAGRRVELCVGDYDDALRKPSGAFVTLRTRAGALRGCIGSIVAVEPLCKAVSSNAVNAAFRDPRFFPVLLAELVQLELEISVMGPIEEVKDVADIICGRDGLIVRLGRSAGLLLPQVATEYGWDRDTFLDQTCVKAGLSRSAWRAGGCRIEKFSAEVFGE